MTPQAILRSAAHLVLAMIVLAGLVRETAAHPHVFVDGKVDFVFDDAGTLTALDVTWRYDLFETLYVLSSLNVVPNPDGSLTPEDRSKLIENEMKWPDGFDGATHLSIDGQDQSLSGPDALDVEILDDNLVVHFRRHLDDPTMIEARAVEIAFYEATYYYAFSLVDDPNLNNGPKTCMVETVPFDPDTGLIALQATLASLGREETPTINNVGALFADRILLDCP